MIRKTTALLGAAVWTGLVVIFIFGFAGEIAAGAMPSTDQTVVGGLADRACSHDPWPYGCDWRASVAQKHIAKRVRSLHHRYVLLTAVRNNRPAAADKL